jgi:hypothetical protein
MSVARIKSVGTVLHGRGIAASEALLMPSVFARPIQHSIDVSNFFPTNGIHQTEFQQHNTAPCVNNKAVGHDNIDSKQLISSSM